MNSREETDSSVLLDEFEKLLDRRAAVSLQEITTSPDPLREFVPVLPGAKPRRQLEFQAGRVAAANALLSLGSSDFRVGIGGGRQPVWPMGYVGSITHDTNFAVAVVAKSSDLAAIGVDIEAPERLTQGLSERIGTDEEFAVLEQRSDQIAKYPDIGLFSLKESVFKCVYPAVNRLFDFLEIEIFMKNNNLCAKPSRRAGYLAEALNGIQLSATYVGGRVLSCAFVVQR